MTVYARKVDALVTELMALQLKTAEIHVRETEIVEELGNLNRGIGSWCADEQADLVASSHRQEGPTVIGRETQVIPTVCGGNAVIVGDRVVIKTVVKKPANWPRTRPWNTKTAQVGTVVRIAPAKIIVLTDNQTETWRLPHNVARIRATGG
jgi:hypothetical protein